MYRRTRILLVSYLNTVFNDRVTAYLVLFIIGLYLVVFGFSQFQEIYQIPLDLAALIILLPILLTDVLKTLIETTWAAKLHKAKEDVSKVTAIIPTYNGQDNIEATIKSLLKKFRPENIIVVSNGSTDSTCDIASTLGVRVIDHKHPVGKADAINLALDQVTTPYTLILDDDTLAGDAVLPTNLLDDGYEGVAFRVLPVQKGLLSILQTHEYRKSMDLGRGFHNTSATVQTISGAIGLFHTKELIRQTALHSKEFCGEDLQRTLLIHLLENKKGVVIADSTVETFVPQNLHELFNQRVFGWYPGLYANIGILLKLIFQKKVPFRLRFEAFYTCFVITFVDPVRIVTLPILLFSPSFLFIFLVTYVALESIPYAVLGMKEPLWVLIVSPFYGLFNFVARFLAGAVFIYRRFSYKLGRAKLYDEYKYVRMYAKLFSGVATVLLYLIAFSLYTYLRILPPEVHTTLHASLTEVLQPTLITLK